VEDECAECILRVPNGTVDAKGRDAQECFDKGIYHAPSIEADNIDVIQTAEGNQPVGLSYTGLAVLDEDALPGIPLTTIQPLEHLMVEAFRIVEELQDSEVKKTMAENTNSKEASAAYCPLCGTQLVEGKCPNKECAAYGKSVQVDEKLAELNMALAKKETLLAEALEKQAITQEQNGKLTEDLAKTKAKSKELEGRLRTTESRVSDRDKRIDELEHDIEALREDIGRLTAAREAAITEKNEAVSNAASASERANSEIQERAKIQRELADLREKTAGAIRREAETSEKLAFESNKHLEYETELKQLKEDLRKRDEAIKQMQAGNEKALIEQKRLYKILRENNIYEVNPDGSLKISS
jgi:DNA repair exonuclease SbcCD ATPase subunit